MKFIFRCLKKFFFYLGLIVIAVLGAWIYFDNGEEVMRLSLFGFRFPESTVGLYFLIFAAISFLMGFLLGILLLAGKYLAGKRALRNAQLELKALRTSPLKE